MVQARVQDIEISSRLSMVAQLLTEANYRIPLDILSALRDSAAREQSELGRLTLQHLVRNYEVAGSRAAAGLPGQRPDGSYISRSSRTCAGSEATLRTRFTTASERACPLISTR